MLIDATDLALTHAERSSLTADLLARASLADDAERERLLGRVIVVNARVARAVAARYRGRGVPLEELEQAACEGLTKAVHRFDPAQERDLLSYAVPTIRGELQRYFRDHSWALRPPRRVQELQARIRRASGELGAALGREPTPDELCSDLEVARAELDEAVQAFGCFSPPSLDQRVGESDDLTLGESLPDVHDPSDEVEARVMLGPVVRRLPARDRHVLYLRYVEDLTQREIGEQYGVPQMQVSRWLDRILRTLRRDLDAPRLRPLRRVA